MTACLACHTTTASSAAWTWTLLGSLCPTCATAGHTPGYRHARDLHTGWATCTRAWRRHHAELARHAQAVRGALTAVAAALLAAAAGTLDGLDDTTIRAAHDTVRALNVALRAETARRRGAATAEELARTARRHHQAHQRGLCDCGTLPAPDAEEN